MGEADPKALLFCRRRKVELHFGRLFRAGTGGEVGPRLEAEEAGVKARGHGIDLAVVAEHRLIEAAAFHRDTILGALELDLEVTETSTCLEIGITLHHDEQAGERGGKVLLTLLKLAQHRGITGRCIRIHAHAGHLLAGSCHLGKGGLLKIRRSLGDPHEVRNQIRAALVDVLHISPALIHRLLKGVELVVAAAPTPEHQTGEKDDGCKNCQKGFHDREGRVVASRNLTPQTRSTQAKRPPVCGRSPPALTRPDSKEPAVRHAPFP